MTTLWKWILGSSLSLILLVVLTYWGYCWGWWGRHSLALQYLFQCRCPAASETARYAPFLVLGSACSNASFEAISPDGRWLVMSEARPTPRSWLVDVQTGQRRDLPLDAYTRVFAMLDERRLIAFRRPPSPERSFFLVFDRQNGALTRLPRRFASQLTAADRTILRNAAEVFVIGDMALALAREYQQHPDQNLLVVTNIDMDWVQQVLAEVGVTGTPYGWRAGDGPVWRSTMGPTGRFYATSDGIYLRATRQRLVATGFTTGNDVTRYRPVAWTADDRAVVYIARPQYVFDDPSTGILNMSRFPVPQPVLLVEVPPEYWEPAAP